MGLDPPLQDPLCCSKVNFDVQKISAEEQFLFSIFNFNS